MLELISCIVILMLTPAAEIAWYVHGASLLVEYFLIKLRTFKLFRMANVMRLNEFSPKSKFNTSRSVIDTISAACRLKNLTEAYVTFSICRQTFGEFLM